MQTPIETKRAAIHTLGCRLNQAETALLEERLAEAGYVLVPFDAPADLGILHTCTVTREADAKSRKLLRQFIRRNPEAYTAVIGCYAQMGADALAEIEGVDLIVGNQEKLNVLDYVAAGKNETPLIVRDRVTREDFTLPFTGAGGPLTRRANLKIQDGCDFLCSFCIIPFARGRARSRCLDDLVAEARQLVARGAKEVVLTGVNIGLYDHEGRSVFDVVQALDAIDGLARIRISSIEPTTIPEALFDCMADPDHALVPHLHIPLQSGANRILEAMRRKYTRESFLDFIHCAADRVPEIGIGTDVLVGFPGETDEDFAQTCDAIEHSPVCYTHVFKYSERPGTASQRLPDKVEPPVASRRSAELIRLGGAKRHAFYQRHLGQTVEVLFEDSENGHWGGYTGNYLRAAVRSDKDLTNKSRLVLLESIGGDVVYASLVE